MVKSILKSFGLSKSQSNPREEIEDIISEEGQKEEAFDAHEKLLLKNILGLRTITAADVMVPRADIVAVDIDESSENIIKKMTTAGHSRLPVFKGDLDKVLGVIHIKDITSKISEKENINIKNLLRPAIFSSPSLRLLDLLQEMRLKRLHLALVLDEFGGVDGLITIEDLVEEIVGEIEDEHDKDTGTLIKEIAKDEFLVSALTPIDVFNEKFDSSLSDKDFDTLGGIVMHHFARFPKPNDAINIEGLRFVINSLERRRIKRIKVSKIN